MPARIEPHAEPIPGYRLIERLGVGGFGEVWKCEAPGGLFKAIKVVHGELGETDSLSDEDSRADQELKALKRVKTVHHPYILSLERFDIVEGQLMIVMELADRTLWDRFKECRAQGLPGIPRAELLGYMRETAEALDLMNDQFQLQHLDIKPQNLFLVFNHVKVADFGLVKDLGNKATATVTGGVTPVYAAPETFDGWLSRYSDQYSLAIVFQELLTGLRPFAGATMRQLVLQHLQGDPDLGPLPAADRPIVARALSKNPEFRFPNCLEFVHQLQAVSTIPSGDSTVAAPAASDEPNSTESAHTHDARGKALGPRPARDSETDADEEMGRPQVLPARPNQTYRTVNGDAASANQDDTPLVSASGTTLPGLRRARAADQALGLAGPVQPALVLGLGGIGLRVLGNLRRRLSAELAHPGELPYVRLLGLDTDPESVQAAGAGEAGQTLQPMELMPTQLHRASHYLRVRDGKPPTESWLNGKLLFRIPRKQDTAGLRALGRLALVGNYRTFARRLEAELQACCDAAVTPPARDEIAPRGQVPRVYVVTALGGNTGSGMFLDVAYAARERLRQLGHPEAEVVGLFFLPCGDPAMRRTALANAFAALTELDYFSRHPFTARYDGLEPHAQPVLLHDDRAPFARCVLFTLPRPSGAEGDATLSQALALAGDALFRDLATPLGQTTDSARRRILADAGRGLQARPTTHLIGINRLSWPRQPLLDKGARRVSRRLVEKWMSKDARPVAEAMTQWADERWDGLGLRPEALIGRLHEWCEKIVHQPPDKLISAITGPLGEALSPRPGGAANGAVGPAVAALAELEKVLGVPEECRAPNQRPPAPGTLETALAEAAAKLAESCEQRLAEQVVRLIEDPRYRLAGSEEALRRLSAAAERALQSQETLARELNERAALLYQHAQKLLEAPAPTTPASNPAQWKLSFSRRTPAPGRNDPTANLIELIRQYPKARFHALALQNINRLYVGLRGQLSDQLREVGFCRQRLSELANLLQPTTPAASDPVPAARVLLPTGCTSVEDALEQLDKQLTGDDLVALDQQIQLVIRQQYRALVNVCMGSSAMVRTLAPAMLARAREFLGPRIGSTSVAELLLNPHGDDQTQRTDQAVSEMQELYQRAMPRNAPSRPDAEVAITVLPGDRPGKELEQLLTHDLPNVAALSGPADEIVCYREYIYLSSAGPEQLGLAAQEAYRQRLAADPGSLHSRGDIAAWQPTPAIAGLGMTR
jgi:serine/threonine protein kinase